MQLTKYDVLKTQYNYEDYTRYILVLDTAKDDIGNTNCCFTHTLEYKSTHPNVVNAGALIHPIDNSFTKLEGDELTEALKVFHKATCNSINELENRLDNARRLQSLLVCRMADNKHGLLN